tara:strand:+ start:876 stop:1346 length:471 start_codon:yes stop_codon:yes gene_type:complete
LINNLIIHYHGDIKYSKEENNILISEDTNWKDDLINKQLQIDYLKINDYIKASQVINQEFGEINNIKIIKHNYDLNMISYQYDYEMIRKNYQTLGNLIFFINLLIQNFSENIKFELILEDESHFKIHQNNFSLSLKNYLKILKKDLSKKYNIELKN